MKVVQLPQINPSEVLVKLLEDLLKRAKSGEIQTIVGTLEMADGCRMSVLMIQKDLYSAIGALEMLKHEYVEYNDRHTNTTE